MRFTLTMPDDLVEQIDEEAERTGTPRAEWIRQACTDALHPVAPGPTPEEHLALREAVQEARTLAALREQRIKELEQDREYHRGEIARLAQEADRLAQANSLLTHRLLPPPRAGGVVSRIRRWWSGSGEQ